MAEWPPSRGQTSRLNIPGYGCQAQDSMIWLGEARGIPSALRPFLQSWTDGASLGPTLAYNPLTMARINGRGGRGGGVVYRRD